MLLGRPVSRSDIGQRQKVVEFLVQQGPTTAVSTLRGAFPAASRAELTHMLQRYRRVLRKRYHDTGLTCGWPVPGRVWAMDFAEPSELGGAESLPPVDGLYPYLLAVRDLASGYQLAWLPVEALTAEAVVQTLSFLFACHGAPLVLKCDNGSAFIAERTKVFLEEMGVMALFSPPHYPPYNGAIEAGIGSLKNRTARHAARHGRFGFWAWEDVEAARWEANIIARPHGLRGVAASQVWQAREPISPLERTRFELTVARHGFDLRAEPTSANGNQLDHWQRSEIDRKTLTRALVEHAYLLVTRRRIPLTNKSQKVANIT